MGESYAGNVQLPQRWAPPNMTGAANNAMDTISGLGQYNTAAGVLPQIQQTVQAGVSNPYRGMAQGTANAIAPQGVQAGQQALNTGQQFMGAPNSLVPYATQMLNTGFDPQNALYDRTAQRVQDQTRVANAASGVGTSPYGAGVEATNMKNFNIDWLDRALGRQNTAAQGASSIYNTAGNAATTGAGLAQQGVGTAYNAGMMPYNTFNTAEGNNLGWYNASGQAGQQAAAIPQMQVGDWMNYLNVGNQANQVQNQNAKLGLDQSQLGWNQLSGIGTGIGKFLGGSGIPGVSSLFGGFK